MTNDVKAPARSNDHVWVLYRHNRLGSAEMLIDAWERRESFQERLNIERRDAFYAKLRLGMMPGRTDLRTVSDRETVAVRWEPAVYVGEDPAKELVQG